MCLSFNELRMERLEKVALSLLEIPYNFDTIEAMGFLLAKALNLTSIKEIGDGDFDRGKRRVNEIGEFSTALILAAQKR